MPRAAAIRCGGDGDDTLTGGEGIVSFVCSAHEIGQDKIIGFVRGEDIVKLEDVVDGVGNDVQDPSMPASPRLPSAPPSPWPGTARRRCRSAAGPAVISATSPSSGNASAPRWWSIPEPHRRSRKTQ